MPDPTAESSPLSTSLYRDLLTKLEITEAFEKAVQPYLPRTLYPQLAPEQEKTFKEYEEKFFQQSVEEWLISEAEKRWTTTEVQEMLKQPLNTVLEDYKESIKALDRAIEDCMDAIYLDAHQLLSGIEITGVPNPADPFAYFTVQRRDGWYEVEAYDFWMLQRMHIKKQAFIPEDKLGKLKMEAITLDQLVLAWIPTPSQVQALATHFSKPSPSPLCLISKQRIICILQDLPPLQDATLILNTPWTADRLNDYLQNLV